MSTRVVWAAIVLLVCLARFCHLDLLWIEEAYPSAAAAEVLRGKILYRDIWFDKPPLYSLIYVLWGANAGIPLRIAGSAFVLACCLMMYRFAKFLWSEPEALLAAGLTAVFLTFGIPSAVIALAPDLLMLPVHVGAVYLAWKGRHFLAGVLVSVCVLVNTKGLLVLPVCLLWRGAIFPTCAGFLALQAVALLWLGQIGALQPYWDQVWAWGAVYAADTFVASPVVEGLKRTANWAGFHAVLVLGAAIYFLRERSWRMAVWAGFSLLAVCGGLRFFPRYYLQLLPVFTLAAARGLSLIPARKRALVLIVLLAVPVARFGPRYIQLGAETLLGRGHEWSDIAMMNDSRDAASRVNATAGSGATLLVWGYRPDIFVFSGLPAGTKFLDSQPLTGVLADRHLFLSLPTFPEIALQNRADLLETAPTYVVDGLGMLNPSLAISNFADLHHWLRRYTEVGRTRMCIIYRQR